ncbi:unnamed protein product [Effrenium voratum]|nr:unnamed protein product [Effrenium voratum]
MAVVVPGQPAQLILDEEDVFEDPFKDRRAGLAPGEVPVMTYTAPAMQVTTIEVPAHADKRFYDSMLQLLSVSSGMVVFRFLGQTVWDKEIYMAQQEIYAELCEIVDTRPNYVVNVARGDVRSLPMAFAALSDVSLAEPDATFGFPEVRVGGLPACVTVAMRKRISDDNIRKLITDGQPMDAREAQRIGLVDFVGDVESELARIIFKNCKPKACGESRRLLRVAELSNSLGKTAGRCLGQKESLKGSGGGGHSIRWRLLNAVCVLGYAEAELQFSLTSFCQQTPLPVICPTEYAAQNPPAPRCQDNPDACCPQSSCMQIGSMPLPMLGACRPDRGPTRCADLTTPLGGAGELWGKVGKRGSSVYTIVCQCVEGVCASNGVCMGGGFLGFFSGNPSQPSGGQSSGFPFMGRLYKDGDAVVPPEEHWPLLALGLTAASLAALAMRRSQAREDDPENEEAQLLLGAD